MKDYFKMKTKKEVELYDLEQREMKLQKINEVEGFLKLNKNDYWLRRLYGARTFDGRYQIALKVNIV
jgi:hypothetical protein